MPSDVFEKAGFQLVFSIVKEFFFIFECGKRGSLSLEDFMESSHVLDIQFVCPFVH